MLKLDKTNCSSKFVDNLWILSTDPLKRGNASIILPYATWKVIKDSDLFDDVN